MLSHSTVPAPLLNPVIDREKLLVVVHLDLLQMLAEKIKYMKNILAQLSDSCTHCLAWFEVWIFYHIIKGN